MILIKVARLLHLISYLLITSQVLFYLLVLGEALEIVSIDTFLELRKTIDPIITGRLRLIYYACLVLSMLVLFISVWNGDKVMIITSGISLVCLVLDVAIALKGNMPINELINMPGFTTSSPTHEKLRTGWITFIRYRGIFSTTGMISLFVGLVTNRNV